MNKLEEVQNWRGMKVVDADGDKIGTIEDVFLDRHTGEPEWATVKTGLFGLKSTFVPIREAQVTGDDQVRVPFQKYQAKNAPRIDADGKLSPEQERELWEYYDAASSPGDRGSAAATRDRGGSHPSATDPDQVHAPRG